MADKLDKVIKTVTKTITVTKDDLNNYGSWNRYNGNTDIPLSKPIISVYNAKNVLCFPYQGTDTNWAISFEHITNATLTTPRNVVITYLDI